MSPRFVSPYSYVFRCAGTADFATKIIQNVLIYVYVMHSGVVVVNSRNELLNLIYSDVRLSLIFNFQKGMC